jgi:hypothetical protein
MNMVMMLPQTERLPPKYGERIRAPSISMVMMQAPLAKAMAAMSARGIVLLFDLLNCHSRKSMVYRGK